MPPDIRWQQRFANFCQALDQLETFFQPPALNERERQGLIKAFEYCFELGWNTLRDLLLAEGNAGLIGSRDTLRPAPIRKEVRSGCCFEHLSKPTPGGASRAASSADGSHRELVRSGGWIGRPPGGG
jgi:hypothetical protein